MVVNIEATIVLKLILLMFRASRNKIGKIKNISSRLEAYNTKDNEVKIST